MIHLELKDTGLTMLAEVYWFDFEYEGFRYVMEVSHSDLKQRHFEKRHVHLGACFPMHDEKFDDLQSQKEAIFKLISKSGFVVFNKLTDTPLGVRKSFGDISTLNELHDE